VTTQTAPPTCRVVITDDHEIIREAIRSLLAQAEARLLGRFEVLDCAAAGLGLGVEYGEYNEVGTKV